MLSINYADSGRLGYIAYMKKRCPVCNQVMFRAKFAGKRWLKQSYGYGDRAFACVAHGLLVFAGDRSHFEPYDFDALTKCSDAQKRKREVEQYLASVS